VKQRAFEIAKEVLRKINKLCDLSHLIDLSRKYQIISPGIIEEILDDGTLF